MGTYIHLYLGRFQIDWGKNHGFYNHSNLFQKFDLGKVKDYGYEKPLKRDGYSRPLRNTICRLELLGYTMEKVKAEYNIAKKEFVENAPTFKQFYDIIKNVDISSVTGKWSDSAENKYIPQEIIDKFGYHEYRNGGSRPDYWDLETALDIFSPYAKLRLLAENPKNLDIPIVYPFGELVKSGWAARKDFLSELDQQQKFLIITEGSSDTKIIKTAISCLRKDYEDFFQFIDVDKGQHFDGTESLYKFCKRLVSIGILNRVIFLYDNDAAGISRYEDTKKLSLPKNIVAAKLPDIPAFRKFDTIGPSGERKENINGKAASIECYLDLSQSKPRVRWSSYIDSIGMYQGALEDKTTYTKKFLSLIHKDINYDYSKIETLLDHLYKICVNIGSH